MKWATVYVLCSPDISSSWFLVNPQVVGSNFDLSFPRTMRPVEEAARLLSLQAPSSLEPG